MGCAGRYSGEALRWSEADKQFDVVRDGVGLLSSLDCDGRKDDVCVRKASLKT